MTDWVFTVLMGGPHPDMDGALDVNSFHVGTTKLGNRFSQAYPHFSQNVMVPYTQFVERVFRKLELSTTIHSLTCLSTAEAATLSRGKDLLPGSTMSSTLAITPGPSSTPDITASNTSTSVPSNIAVSTSGSDLLLASELLSIPQGNDAFYSFSGADVSLSPMDDNLSLPILPMPPQPHDAIYSLRELLQGLSHEHPLEQGPLSLPNVTYQFPDAPVSSLTSDVPIASPKQAVAQPNPYYPPEPTFIFLPSSPPLTQPHSSTSHLPSGTLPTQTPASPGRSPSWMRLSQIPPGAEASSIAPVGTGGAEASPIAPVSTGGEKRACEPQGEQSDVSTKRQKANAESDVPTKGRKADAGTRHRTTDKTIPTNLEVGRGKRLRVQSKRAAEANNIGAPFMSRKK